MNWLSRQSFLGKNSSVVLKEAKVGIVGLGGGGSHIAQQLAHVGVGNFLLVDPDSIEEHNLNRLVGGTVRDVRRKASKVEIARRVILGVQPHADIKPMACIWQHAVNELRKCDVIFGCVDSFRERDELERFCRQNLIPYIDIGMDVTKVGPDYLVAGQTLLSMPGQPCLRCVGVITEERLEREAETYGAAGPHAQVIWPNGVLASLAVGFFMQLLTPWHRKPAIGAYREYDANSNTVRVSPKWRSLEERKCPHHPEKDRGDPTFDIRQWLDRQDTSPAGPSLIQKLLEEIRDFWSAVMAGRR